VVSPASAVAVGGQGERELSLSGGGVDSKAEESLNLLLRGLEAPTELDRGEKAS
jgi:hypothetical protein